MVMSRSQQAPCSVRNDNAQESQNVRVVILDIKNDSDEEAEASLSLVSAMD